MSEKILSLADLVRGMKPQDNSDGENAMKDCQSLRVKSIDTANYRISAVASTDSIDRDGDIILPTAFKKSLPGYMKNPILLAAHQHRLADGHSPVVGSVVDARIAGREFHVVVEFEPDTELGKEYWVLYSKKRQRAFSVGFIPIKSEVRTINKRSVRVHTEVELIEISCVPVPSNREALSRSAKKKEWLACKRSIESAEEIEAGLEELKAADPDFDSDAEEFAKALFDDQEEAAERFYTFREVGMLIEVMRKHYKSLVPEKSKRVDFASKIKK